MKEMDPLVFLAVFQEMFGWLFLPLAVLIVLGGLLFIATLIRDRGIRSRPFLLAEIVGILGGFAGVWLMLAITSSSLSDMGGPIDWLLAVAIWLAGAIGATVIAYIVLAVYGTRRPA